MKTWFHSQRLVLTIFFISILLAGCSGWQTSPETSYDGLERIQYKGLDTVYRKPGIELGNYKHLMVTDCSVAFKSDWQRRQNITRAGVNRISDDDIAKIQTHLGQLCREVFVEELTRDGGYQVVDSAAADVMRLQPKIIDLEINAPDKMIPGRTSTYTTSAGSMTLYLEAYDSVSGEIVSRIIDQRKDIDENYLEWTNSVTNIQEAKRALRRWGQTLREMLDSELKPH